jgi:hypothetical protein
MGTVIMMEMSSYCVLTKAAPDRVLYLLKDRETSTTLVGINERKEPAITDYCLINDCFSDKWIGI